MECLTYLLGFSLLVQVIAKDIFLNEDISLSKKAATKFLVRRKRGWWTNAAEECREGCSWEECEENSSSREGGREIMKQYKCRSYTCTSGCTNTNSNYGHINYLTVGCIVHGGWSSWGSWSSCTKSCGSGTRYHTRSCSNPSPKNGGNYCSGSTSAYASCNTHACPINGGWSSYGSYGSCSKSCGTGYKYSYRYCNNPSPAHGGKSCSGSSITSSTCNTQACPVNGVWSEWSKYSACPVTCGGGTNTRTRACDNPAPAHGGKDCDGTSSEKGACNTLACPNYCGTGPCRNGAACANIHYGYQCTCLIGFEGTNCETNIDDCVSVDCQHGGRCIDKVNAYSCECVPGYAGRHCELDINECASGPCKHGGSCTDNVNGYTCYCVPGYDGVHCETNIDECASGPCDNGGSCTDKVNGYTCTCAPGYNGVHYIDECASGPCDNGGSCTDEVNGYTCTCAPGYNGVHCEIDINECASGPCEHGGSCTDNVNGYTCSCVPGYDGVHCEINIDECALIPCKNGGSCTDGINEYSCACVPGYTGSDCEININECESDPCNNGGTCNDEVNGYSCDCAPGYMDDTCQTDIDECAPLPCENDGSCEDRVNGYHCSCVGQFYGENCQNHDGGWSIWSEFSVCSTTCGSGVQIATRDCSSPEPIGGGKNCEGEQYKTQTCSNEAECAESPFVNSDFCSGKADGFYSNQLTCDAYYVCHNGITSPMFCDHGLHWDQTNKVCNHPDNAGCTVNEQSDDTRSGYTSDMCISKNEGDFVADPYDCSIYYRCVHGAAVQMNCVEGLHWSVTLSTCTYPADANCTPMSVNGGWTDWSWSKCSVSCGSGTQTGSRSCTNPAPLHGGNACVGETTKVQECNSYLCQDGQCLTVRCDSWQYARHECEVTGLTSNSLLYSMTLLKQYSPISDGECTDGYSFGYNTTGVWVDDGCRADFSVCFIPEYNDCGSDPCQNGASCEDGPGTYTCTCEGYFSGINCEHRIECPEPEDVGNATMNMTGISPTDTVSYACDEYYKRKDGDMYRVCQINGEWNGTLPSCELIDCGRPEEHSTTQLQLFETGPGQVATYVCKEESPVLAAGNLTRTCLMIGEWDGQTPECMMHPGALQSKASSFNFSWKMLNTIILIGVAMQIAN
ncbi:Delta and Notch-like epidermal growth factor-related receptor,Delta-like protein B,Fibropellin-1,Protocadherin Fat 1,Protein jagged-1b,Fibropellin-3,Coadhesin,Neurogenic locus protein delta,Protein crumbs homolog 1,Thrombospondin-2,Sushi, nidogen and EGF-like domain-containing protein 1,Protein jagged-1,Protein eyes shut,Delta-like protein 1,Protein jagged-1a,Delta-like protein 4,Neurogenic locus notch homolog protein 2,Protein crumbs,Neurogenic locus notch homolog protein 4,Sushi, von Willebrand factor ty|uniref:Uncharacterized protein n=1 Tax=Mytilus edulis TaxID=6550 RepID=A0A8S3T1H1_MYTED|nr:Delta and Notch-like epidermal growth factor-related receptor,Delta-like protein B,Fibropellin-1,Protocadherin Fat 1,Protein jagged-1b,Fibropellin-3,Coadhesin,Neurogenic locus protein delta,Protein crumbs homolog 1,Thrombospondin-2,Sushi, nidogen and EGF-like domain-containing protein 1,Protein jagged-1,Protein eyes shut,Delta-like protein 1,Protein jagged-1a,Delta-like protein 4,Neurogenic locus notch homolog protein 2,Protein crumbs,Neurogenic locus notch homolog protein 4,Sushi, von Willebran